MHDKALLIMVMKKRTNTSKILINSNFGDFDPDKIYEHVITHKPFNYSLCFRTSDACVNQGTTFTLHTVSLLT